ncbi:MAG: toll/interleukin-1 receptor domain-containing protein [Opitutaceae bacterium]|nr:toll/interleukin-1 receptor domain-containing protein [Opitutaceae bacterium]
MFNIIVSSDTTAWETDQVMRMDGDRFMESGSSEGPEAARVRSGLPASLSMLENTPTLLFYEQCDKEPPADVIRFGKVRNVHRDGSSIGFLFTEEGRFTRATLAEYKGRLQAWVNRTHWAVKEASIPKGMMQQLIPANPPGATNPPQVSDSVIHPPGSTPRVFFSYSHDSAQHKAWVLNLATRLMNNGVEVILDQWDLRLGGDLPTFMERSLTVANRVVVVCTDKYVAKANAGLGGVGYEKMILTAGLMQNINSDRIIPLVREGHGAGAVPTFLQSRLYVDFRNPAEYETKYQDLVREIHGAHLVVRPPLGQNPFSGPRSASPPTFSPGPERYATSGLSGQVTFDYSNNDGRFSVGVGDHTFETKWSSASGTSIHAYCDGAQVDGIALVSEVRDFADIQDARTYDFSSRTRTPHIGEIVIWRNTSGYFMASRVVAVSARSRGASRDEVSFEYKIAQNGSYNFR